MPPATSIRTSEALWSLLSAALHDTPARPLNLARDEWDGLMDLARFCGIAGMLYPAVVSLPAPRQPPPDLLTRWRMTAMQTAMREARRASLATDIAGAMEAGGVRVIGLKGIVLRSLYPHPDLREMGDVDLLVRPGDLAAAGRVLERAGLRRISVQENLENWWHPTGTLFEIHHRLFVPRARVRGDREFEEALRTRASRTEAGGGGTIAPQAEDSAVYAVLHMVKHIRSNGFGPRDFADLAVLMRAGVDPMRLVERLERHNAVRFGMTVLLLCHGFLDTALSSDASSWSREIGVDLLRRLGKDALDAGVHGGGRLDRGLAMAAIMQETYKDRSRACPRPSRSRTWISTPLRVAFPERAHLGERYRYAWDRPWMLPLAWIHRLAVSARLPRGLWERARAVRRVGRMTDEKRRLLSDLQVLDY